MNLRIQQEQQELKQCIYSYQISFIIILVIDQMSQCNFKRLQDWTTPRRFVQFIYY